ncbi:hypothetical protein [Halorussus lipolyticus]|uniref:hypothetical protein n=1 Tax=Halorussus lipolyticus TaxID=3034024 RepID=UPI0023E8EC4B|nr:hypothetical protein [Halorussus sp. DT80]
MGVRSALETMGRFVAAVMGLYLVVALGALLLVVAGRTLGGYYPVPSESAAGPVSDLALFVSVLVASWFVVEDRSLRHLFAFAVSFWAFFFVPVLAIGALDSVLGPFLSDASWAGAVVVLVGIGALLGAYRLVYPASFAERREQFGIGS